MSSVPAPTSSPPPTRAALYTEVTIVLLMTLGYSAITSILTLCQYLFSPQGIGGSATTLNPQLSYVVAIDMLLRFSYGVKLFAAGALVWYLLSRTGNSISTPFSWPRDLGRSCVLAAIIGIPGILLVSIARALHMNVQVTVTSGSLSWIFILILVFLACANAFIEECIVVAYLGTRCEQLGFSSTSIACISSIIRGLYHLYQGIGGMIGNTIMGFIFYKVWRKSHNTWVLVGAHAIIDSIAFVGYAVIVNHFPELLNLIR